MRVLIIGSGGREHALAWKIKQSPKLDALYCAPGNGGISDVAECVDIKADDIDRLLDFASKKKIGLVVVGPEAPLIAGSVNRFAERKIRAFGPTRECARLEGSKVFAKELMRRLNVPTASFEAFDDPYKAKAHISQKGCPLVVKADGIAAGKGVIVARTKEEAFKAVELIMEEKAFGKSGDRVVIEECLEGEEASIMALSDGTNIALLPSSQDHKRIFDNDKGPNTGGMGAYSPAPVITEDILKKVRSEIMLPVISAFAHEGKPYKGVLYAGIMVTPDGPKILEFNVRFGDPETQAVLPRLKGDLVEMMESCIDGSLSEAAPFGDAPHALRAGSAAPETDERSCVSVVLASKGYPGEYEKGKEITGFYEVKGLKDVMVFHAGTKKEEGPPEPASGANLAGEAGSSRAGRYVTNGGRVLNVTALGDDLRGAIDKAYSAVKRIHFEGMHYRKDIGRKGLAGCHCEEPRIKP